MHQRALRSLAAAAALTFAVTACGQKPGVHIDGAGAPLAGAPASGELAGDVAAPATTDAATTTTGDAAGGAVVTDPGAGTTTSGGSGTASSSTTTTSGSTGSSTASSGGGSAGNGSTGGSGGSGDAGGGTAGSGQQDSAASGNRQVTGNDRTGASAEELVFASHAPVTGAAPLPTTSFEKSGDLYWRYLTEMKGETVLGRSKVSLLFRDDKYDPNSARQVCRELASKAFVVSGGGGTDQIQACGQFAQVAKVPYFSAGVTEAGLRGNPWYYAASMSYKQQGILLAQMVKKNFAGKKVAAIVTDTPNFDDAVEGWEAGVKQSGLDYAGTLRHPKGDTSWYNAFANELSGKGVEVVYILSSPVDYIRFAQQASQGGYTPQYVGVGVSMGLNAVLGSGCPQVDGGMFFSPFPGLDYGRKNVPEFFEAASKFGVPNDDIALALWGTNEIMHQLLQGYGQVYGDDLTREDFRDFVETQSGVKGKVFPTLNYSPQDHFGSKAVHLLKANCGTGEHETVATFASSF